MNLNFEEIKILLLLLAVVVVVFIVLREFVTWYWKINKRLELMEEQNQLLKNIFIQLGGSITDPKDVSQERLDDMLREGAITEEEYHRYKKLK